MITIILIVICLGLIAYAASEHSQKKELIQETQEIEDSNYLKKESLVSEWELIFYKKLEKMFGNDFKIQAQVNMASIIDKRLHTMYRNELFRNIDFGIFDKDTLKPLLMIELNDKTHKQRDRHMRDLKVRDILQSCNLPLVTFYSNMPNEDDYVYEKINIILKQYRKTFWDKLTE